MLVNQVLLTSIVALVRQKLNFDDVAFITCVNSISICVYLTHKQIEDFIFKDLKVSAFHTCLIQSTERKKGDNVIPSKYSDNIIKKHVTKMICISNGLMRC